MMLALLIIAVLVVAAFATHYLQQDPGYVLLSYGEWSVEMSLAVAGFIIIFGFLFVNFALTSTSFILTLPTHIRRWLHKRYESKANEALRQGLIAHTEGKWEHAEKALIAQAKKSPHPMVHYLAAARAAHAQEAHDRVEEYLRQAERHAEKNDFTVQLTRAELEIERGEPAKALAHLSLLREKDPKNGALLVLMAKSYQELSQWQELASLLIDIKKYKAMIPEKFAHLEKKAAQGLLRSAEISSLTELHTLWDSLSKEIRQDSSVIAIFAEQLTNHERGDDDAEIVLRETINKHWDKRLVHLYGALETSSPQKQLESAEKWLKEHQSDAALLFALGRICLRNRLWGKARDYLETSLRIDRNAEAYHTLALLLEQMNEPDRAAECYRKGLEVSAHQVFEYFPTGKIKSDGVGMRPFAPR